VTDAVVVDLPIAITVVANADVEPAPIVSKKRSFSESGASGSDVNRGAVDAPAATTAPTTATTTMAAADIRSSSDRKDDDVIDVDVDAPAEWKRRRVEESTDGGEPSLVRVEDIRPSVVVDPSSSSSLPEQQAVVVDTSPMDDGCHEE
jgi:hypothetical protein